MRESKMRKWSVHLSSGKFIGYVHEKTEELARLAALSAYSDIIGDDSFSVMER